MAAGYPEGAVKAFLDAYHELEQAEVNAPGHLAEPAAAAFVQSSRVAGRGRGQQLSLGRGDRARDPVQRDQPVLAGAVRLRRGAGAPRLEPGHAPGRARRLSRPVGRQGRLLAGHASACVAGIATEIYGFYLRIQISGWAPVTNMYETVIWVALVAAVLSLVFELIFRQVFVALAGSAVALLGTITAANVPLLDPSIKSLQPVLRSNLWLTIHVLTEVSSYAAFGLAWALGPDRHALLPDGHLSPLAADRRADAAADPRACRC